jgi:hypothetical protein
VSQIPPSLLSSAFDEVAIFAAPPSMELWTSATKLRIVLPDDAPAEFDLTSLCLLDQFAPASRHPINDRNQGRATLWARTGLASFLTYVWHTRPP